MRFKDRLTDWRRRLGGEHAAGANAIPDALWQATLKDLPFLANLSLRAQDRLKRLSEAFLSQKEFFGANGLEITDAIGVSIAAQACLVVLHMTPFDAPPRATLAAFQDFVTIVVHPGEMLAEREWIDDVGVVHHGHEQLTGEAAEDGPVTLSWSEVQRAGVTAIEGTNVVIHEFIHKLAMQGPRFDDMPADCPKLPNRFMGCETAKEAICKWFVILEPAFEAFQDQVVLAERFGQAAPWLDSYGATAIEEFFPVTGEAYFVNRERFQLEFPALMAPYDALFRSSESLKT